MSGKTFNTHAQSSFAASAAYDQHRPTYSPTIVQFLLENLNVAGKHGAHIVDLAAGTGKLTEALAAREEQFDITAVEPHDGMREVLEAKKLPRVRVVEGTGESMPAVASGSVDAVLVAQAFHWFANMPALKEIHRVLRRHGGLGLVWNAEEYNQPRDQPTSTPGETRLREILLEVIAEAGDREPRFRDLEWRKVFDEQVKKTPLSLIKASDDQLFSLPIGQHLEPFEVALSVEQAWQRYNTLGHISTLQGEAKERVYKEFLDALTEGVEQDEKGNVILHGNTWAVWTMKIPAEGADGLADVQSETS
ncbi:hypothetical protein M409DRAFT_20875 [Zasmidium cellare ATCC 36951]|uniref:Methyltransferase type 11 domain-containing protein n=1 Tax=Zasmidium cellare ATCC 36951 TaxID=1080233 RepID=A0A6A6CSR3_ZASCE|nr:uncharacterized protein M409DRAFT_20875 [Zasmidium cellare ATCC 36951]KAF2168862.1 hypothetical protein M409DRAFT_20875 [Zasmidium cellare ATCC 36951]